MPDRYLGRELAWIKHGLLESYLEKLFLIVGMSAKSVRVSEICYVDCFAGPWGDESEDLSTTSIAISLQILDRCRKALLARGIHIKFRALYIERDRHSYQRLKRYVDTKTPDEIDATSREGDFVALRDEILDWCGENAFAFFFIDPTGWKEVKIEILRPLLRRPRSEFLINFMYDFVNRTASMADWQAEVAALLGETVELDNLPAAEREGILLGTYRKNLKGEMRAGRWPARSAYVRVLDREKERAKYHLIYLTTHPLGIIKFMEISEGVDVIQKQVRASTRGKVRAQKSGMNDLFTPEVYADLGQPHVNATQVEAYWLQYLTPGVRRVGEGEFANLLESTNWFPSDFQSALSNLIAAKKVRNLDAIKARPKKPLHWEKQGERLTILDGTK